MNRRYRNACLAAALSSCVYGTLPPVVLAQQADPNTQQASDAMVALNLPEQFELKLLVTLISDQLKVKIIYDEQIGNKKVTVKSPQKLPQASLLGLLRSVLQIKGMILVQEHEEGWYKIVPVRDLAAVSVVGESEDASAVTRLYTLEHASAKRVDQILKPFLSKPGGSSIAMPERGMILVTDYVGNMKRLDRLMAQVDQPGEEMVVRSVPVANLTAADAGAQLKQILAAQTKLTGEQIPFMQVEILEDKRSNQLTLVGLPSQVERAVRLLAPVDADLGLRTEIYRFHTASPTQVDNLIKSLIGELSVDRLYKSAVDEKAGLLVVTATEPIHGQLGELTEQIDFELRETEPTMRFYKLQNASVMDVLDTIRQLEDVQVSMGDSVGAASPTTTAESAGDATPEPVRQAGAESPLRQPSESSVSRIEDPVLQGPRQSSSGEAALSGIFSSYDDGIVTEDARVVADTNTNTLIVVAEPAVHERYVALLSRLDKRRPQVMIEATLITMDTSDDFSLGVELSAKDLGGGDSGKVLTFSAFGLSEVDAATGALSLVPGLGFNGAVIESDVADVVVRALKTDGRSKVMSSPKILVNDNATATLDSVQEAPFSSVNASNTVSTTSFGGFEEAGTKISVTPQISEGDHLKLTYTVSLSNFESGGDADLPPPRQRNDIESEVTIPDGYTVIVGGLNRVNTSETIQKIPLLGDIPLLEYLFSSRTSSETNSTLFVFLRPVILRDDAFKDLKYLSSRDLAIADLPGNYPRSEAMLME